VQRGACEHRTGIDDPILEVAEELHEQLWPLAEAIRDLAARFLADARDSPAELQTDAARLDRAGADLAAAPCNCSTRPRGRRSAPADVVRRVRHDLLQHHQPPVRLQPASCSRPRRELPAAFRADLERIRDLSKESERLIQNRNRPAPTHG